ncbi:EamA family transporter [Clostridium akagii]|uniref:EamA family transporter n=1 Tax=Clostridium akagii TaxID=91623 RepID=UPI00047C05D0|nr:EamA family transporter [Clostridium akagii]
MSMYMFSIIIIVVSNIMYNICSKSIPAKANPFSSLLITYLTAAIITMIALKFYKTDNGLVKSFQDLNWASVALGFSIVGLELGYIMAYRAGWNISLGSLVANIILAVMLIPIGILFFKEGFGLNKIFGIVLCILGLILINKK